MTASDDARADRATIRANWEHFCNDHDIHPSDMSVSLRAFNAGWRAADEWAGGRAETTTARAVAWNDGYVAAARDFNYAQLRMSPTYIGSRTEPPTTPNPYRAAGRAETTTATTEDAAILARECDLADAEMRKWVRVPVKHVRGLLATARTRPTLAEISLRLALEMGCERVYDDDANAYYCNEHDVGWLMSTNQCARAERLGDAVRDLLNGGVW